MAEICQILFVTLLLYLIWLPSGGSALVDSDGNSTGVLARPETGGSFPLDSDGNSTGVLAHPETEGQGNRVGTNVRRQSSFRCRNRCLNGGNCVEPGICECQDTYFGDQCELGGGTFGEPGPNRPKEDDDPPPPTPKLGYHPERFTPSEDYIIRLLTAYMILGCEAASNMSAVFMDNRGDDRGDDRGNLLIISILETYFESDCKGGRSSFSKLGGSSGLSKENEIIVKALLAYYTDGCGGAVATINLSPIKKPASDLVLINAKGFILRLLSNYFRNGCKGGTEKTVQGVGKWSDGGRHLQSVVLELFLLIFGVSLARLEL